MERSLYYVRLFPGTGSRYDRLHAEVPTGVTAELKAAGLRDITGYRRGTDVWWYAECEPDRMTAFRRYAAGTASHDGDFSSTKHTFLHLNRPYIFS